MTAVLPCSAVLFDCDGVLVDSDDVVTRSWTRWSRAMRLDPEAVLATVHGRRAADTVAAFVEPDGRAAALALIDALELEDATDVAPIPGAAALLGSIPTARWATVTSGSPVLARARLVAAGLPVPDVLVTSADVVRGKPDPEGYLAAASHLGVPAGRCAVVEDSPAGIRAARAAGARYVLRVGDRDLGDLEVTAEVADLRGLAWTGDGLEVL